MHNNTLTTTLQRLFGQAVSFDVINKTLLGWATTDIGQVRILGTVDAAAMNQDIALRLSNELLNLINQGDKTPVVFIIDTQGQDLSRADELLCLNATFAHLASCVQLLKDQGHPNLAIIFGQAVSGGFLSYGLMANEIYAFDDSQVKVMDLNAMARVTKIDIKRLHDLSQASPIFAPGVENFYKMGAIREIWSDISAINIGQLLQQQTYRIDAYQHDDRAMLAKQRQGRLLCHDIIEKILAA